MAVKKTIAIVGATEKAGIEIANEFASEDYRLLLVSDNMEKLSDVTEKLSQKKPAAEIESIECVKDGCWEADIIVLAVAANEEKMVAEMMKEVATQKIVVSLSDCDIQNEQLQKILPYSKLVNVSYIANSKEISIAGNNAPANKEISDIFLKAGYYLSKNLPLVHN